MNAKAGGEAVCVTLVELQRMWVGSRLDGLTAAESLQYRTVGLKKKGAHKVRVRKAAILTGGKESEHIGKFIVVFHIGF